MLVFFIVCYLLAAANAHHYSSSYSSSSELGNHHKKHLVCYYDSSIASTGYFRLRHHVSAKLCTDIVYSSIGITDTETIQYDQTVDIVEGGFAKVNRLKLNNTKLKTLLFLKTGSFDSPIFSGIISDINKRDRFSRVLYNFTRLHKFDGVVLDWEFPSNRGKLPFEKVHFSHFINVLKMRFKAGGLVVAAAVSAHISYLDSSYHVPSFNKHLDMIFLMTNDYHEDWSCITGCESPLYPIPTDWDKNFNVHGSVKAWLDAGANSTKMLLAIPMYGNTCILRNTSYTGISQEHKGPGPMGPESQTPGILYFNEICRVLAHGWTEVMQRYQRVPYAYKGEHWMSYENPESVAMKARYVKKYQLGGTVVSYLHHDDFKNICGYGHYPLIRAIRKYQV